MKMSKQTTESKTQQTQSFHLDMEELYNLANVYKKDSNVQVELTGDKVYLTIVDSQRVSAMTVSSKNVIEHSTVNRDAIINAHFINNDEFVEIPFSEFKALFSKAPSDIVTVKRENSKLTFEYSYMAEEEDESGDTNWVRKYDIREPKCTVDKMVSSYEEANFKVNLLKAIVNRKIGEVVRLHLRSDTPLQLQIFAHKKKGVEAIYTQIIAPRVDDDW